MKNQGFKKAGILNLPVHPPGYVVTVLAILFMVTVTLGPNGKWPFSKQ